MTNKITVFASGNGDSVLIQAHSRTVMTDVNYRASLCQDEDNKEAPDFTPEVRDRLPQGPP